MKFKAVCIYTNNVLRLAKFYEFILKDVPDGDETHMAFDNLNLAIYNPGNVQVSECKSMALIFEVADVDKEYGRLMNSNYNIEFLRIPTIMPWGVKSFIFTDPDGNEISFLTPVTQSS